jgi:hypothetical protein
LKKSTTYRHFREQVRYDQQHPDGFTRLEVYLARLTAMIYNTNINRETTVPASAEEMIIDFGDLRRKRKRDNMMSLEETEALVVSLFGG